MNIYQFFNWKNGELLFKAEGNSKAEALVSHINSLKDQMHNDQGYVRLSQVDLNDLEFRRGPQDLRAIDLFNVKFDDCVISNCIFDSANTSFLEFNNCRVINNNFSGLLSRISFVGGSFLGNDFEPIGENNVDTVLYNWFFDQVNKDRSILTNQDIDGIEAFENALRESSKNSFEKIKIKNFLIKDSNFIADSFANSLISNTLIHNASFENCDFKNVQSDNVMRSGYILTNGAEGNVPNFVRMD